MHHFKRLKLRFVLIVSLLCQAIPLAVVAPQAAQAATLSPGCTAGVGDADALIEAIATANTNNQADTILLVFGCTYTLSAVNNNTFGPNGLPAILNDGPSHGLTLIGNGATIARSDAPGTPDFRLFYVSPNTTLILKEVTLRNGRAVGFAGGNGAAEDVGPNNGGAGGGSAGVGGAIFNNNGTLQILNSTLVDNQAVGGPGGNGLFGWMGAGGGGGLGGPGGSGALAPEGATSGGGGGSLGPGGNGSDADLTGGDGGENGGGAGGTTAGGGNGLIGAGGGGSNADLLHVFSTDGVGNGGFGGGGGGGATSQTGQGGLKLAGRAGYGGGNGARFGGGNGGSGMGGALASVGGQITLIGSTFNGNSALGGAGGSNASGAPGVNGSGYGGAILLYAESAGPGLSAIISNTTVSGNTAAGRGGGIAYADGGGKDSLSHVFIDQSTITLNTAGANGGGLAHDFPDYLTTLNPDNLVSTFIGLAVRNTIIANNTSSSAVHSDLYGSLLSAGNNVIGNVDGASTLQSMADQTGTTANPLNPLLGSLANNGGSTQTHALLVGSPAIAAGLYPCATTDQRGFPRSVPSGENGQTRCSVGAYEAPSPTNTGIGAIFVNSTATTVADDGFCTLIEAITAANSGAASGVTAGECAANATSAKWIYLQPGATYTFDIINNTAQGANALPVITSNIKIIGNGATLARSEALGTPDFRLFYAAPGSNFTLLNATVTNGRAASGGALYAEQGALQLENTTFANNTAVDDGGAVYIAFSGSVDNYIFNSTFNNNLASGSGGAIFVNGNTIFETNLVMRHNTLSGNSAGNTGGGLAKNSTSKVEMGGVLIADNAAGSAPDVDGDYTSYGDNLIGNATGATGFTNIGDQAGTAANPINPQIGPLQNNESPVATMALLPGSPAIGTAESAGSCLSYDQRGVRRPAATNCSKGAFEPVNAQTGPTFVVNAMADTDGEVCLVGFCSLRAAINAVNSMPANPATPYRINFSVPPESNDFFLPGPPTPAVQTILLNKRLPALRNPVIIDGTTQPGYVFGDPTLGIAWDAYPSENPMCSSTSTFYCHGPIFQITAGNTTIKGVQISGALDSIFLNTAQVIGIYIQGPGGNHIEDNVFADALAQAVVIDDSPNNVIKNNLIDIASIGFGAIAAFPYRYLDGTQRSVTGTVIQGNTIRTSLGYPTLNFANGAITMPDATNSLIGGLGAGEGNIIESGQFGISIKGNGNRLLSNQIYFVRAGAISTQRADGSLPKVPYVINAVPNAGNNTVLVQGIFADAPSTSYTLQLFSSAECLPSFSGEAQEVRGTFTITTDITGTASFSQPVFYSNEGLTYISGLVTGPDGSTSNFSNCSPAQPANTSWSSALSILPNTPITSFVALPGETRWFKFPVRPASRADVALSNLPTVYNATVFNDIAAAYSNTLTTTQGIAIQQAQLDYDAIESSNFVTNTLDPAVLAPEAFTAQALNPTNFRPNVLSKAAVSPFQFSPFQFSPFQFSPFQFSPFQFSPFQFSPFQFSPFQFSPFQFSPFQFSPNEQYASAVSRSYIAATDQTDTAPRNISANTWNNNGYYYVSVTGRNSAYTPLSPFTLQVNQAVGDCTTLPQSAIDNIGLQPILPATAGNFNTILLTFPARLPGSAAEKAALDAALSAFKVRGDVNGVVVDVSADGRVAAANALADSFPACPYAKNLIANAVKGVVDRYRAVNPALQYVVIVGGDNVIPFVRYPDEAMLGNESTFAPPVQEGTPSQASLKLGYITGQDAYGSSVEIPFKTNTLPVPQLAVGRLVENAAEATTMLNAFIAANGIVSPTSSLVSGYDFHYDSATDMVGEFQAGMGTTPDTLLSPSTQSNQAPGTWTADDLRAKLLNQRHDILYLAGHFSDGGLLAADYSTSLLASELISASANLSNAIIFSPGCHVAYNTVDGDSIGGVTQQPDWAQAFARKGATLIGGTGYQYGDTDFATFGELLYLNFAQQLRIGPNAVPIGNALVAAKQRYLLDTPEVRGLDVKTLVISTLYGLPMLRVNIPNKLVLPGNAPSIVTALTAATTNPGLTLGLTSADVSITPAFALRTLSLADPLNPADLTTATYLSGTNGVVSKPGEPVLPLEIRNVTPPTSAPANTLLRGVGFRGGSFTDLPNLLPLTGAPATELRGVHLTFGSDYFYPIQPWSVNYYGAIISNTNTTRLMVTLAQFQSNALGNSTGTLRRFDNLNFRLFYSDNTQRYGQNVPALANAPFISKVSGNSQGPLVNFAVSATGDPSAGIQQVWVTYAGDGPLAGQWQSLDLTQSVTDTTLWLGQLTLPSGANAANLRFMAQAVNGVGLIALNTNGGLYYQPNVDPAIPVSSPAPISTTLNIQAPASAAYGTLVNLSATLRDESDAPIANQVVAFTLDSLARQATTNAAGVATVSMPLYVRPGAYDLSATFVGSSNYKPASTTTLFTITKQNTSLVIAPASAAINVGASTGLTATLTDASGTPLVGATVVWLVTGASGTLPSGTISASVKTDFAGRAPLGLVALGAGNYTASAYFGGSIPAPVSANIVDPNYNAAAPASASLTISGAVDPTPPDTSLISTPLSITNSTTATFTFTGTDNTTPAGALAFECQLDGGAFAACSTPATFTNLASITHTFSVRAKDAAGNVDPTPPSFTWLVDTVPPVASITSGPISPTSFTTATFTFTATDSGAGLAGFQCQLDAAAFAACTSPQSYGGLSLGAHVFRVTATDRAGNVSAPVSQTWIITATPVVVAPVVTTTAASNVMTNTATLNGSVAPNGNTITATFRWGTQANGPYTRTVNATPLVNTGTTTRLVSATLSALTPNTTYYYQAVITSSLGVTNGAQVSFTTAAAPIGLRPVATTTAASNVTTNTAVLNGSVAPNGNTITATFRWGTQANGPYTRTVNAAPLVSTGNATRPISATLTGLTPNTTYYYQAIITSNFGVTNGAQVSFTTAPAAVVYLPIVTTTAATNVTTTTATLNGIIALNGNTITATFRWGAQAGGPYTRTLNATPLVSTGTATRAISATVTGLRPNTTYYYQAVITSSLGVTNGAQISFTTAPTPTLPPAFPATPVLDTFNRANGGIGNSWTGFTSGYSIKSNALKVGDGGPLYWKGAAAFGVNQEAYATLAAVDNTTLRQGLLLKVQSLSITDFSLGAIAVLYEGWSRSVHIETYRTDNYTWSSYSRVSVTFKDGDVLGARALANGEVWIYKNGQLITKVTLTNADKTFFNARGGRIGLTYLVTNKAVVDNFGGGTVP